MSSISTNKSKQKKVFTSKEKYESAIALEDVKIQKSEDKIVELKRMLEELEAKKPKSKSKSSVVKTAKVVNKKSVNKSAKPPKEHQKVQSSYLNLYDYKKKLSIWKKSAGDNLTTQGCDKCKGKQFKKTILLDNGQHVCWFCWIKKPDSEIKSSKSAKKKRKN